MDAPDALQCSCGCCEFFENTRVSGWWKTIIDGYGEPVEVDLDSLRHSPPPKTVGCIACGKRYPNPNRL